MFKLEIKEVFRFLDSLKRKEISFVVHFRTPFAVTLAGSSRVAAMRRYRFAVEFSVAARMAAMMLSLVSVEMLKSLGYGA